MGNKNNFEENLLKTKNRVRNIIVLSLFVVICSLLYLMSFFTLKQVKDAIEEQYIEDGKNVVRAYSTTIQNLIEQVNLSLDMYSKMPVIKTGEDGEIFSYFNSPSFFLPSNVLLLFYSNTFGEAFTSNGKTMSVVNEDCYKAIMSGNYIRYLGNSTYSELLLKDVVYITRTVFDSSSNIKGVLGAAIDTGTIRHLLKSIETNSNLTPFIYDADGISLTGEDEEYGALRIKNSNKAILTRAHQFNSYTTITGSGERLHVFLEAMSNFGYVIGVTIPDSKIFSTYNKLSYSQRAIFIMIFFVGLILYIFSILLLDAFQKRMEDTKKLDPLTELLNRAEWEKEANEQLNKNPAQNFVCIEGDFSGFKFINQTYGEKAGTDTLIKFSQTLKKIKWTYGGLIARGYADHFYYFNKITSIRKFMSILQVVQEGIKELSQKGPYQFNLKYGISFRFARNINAMGEKTESVTISTLLGEASIAKKTIKGSNDVSFAIYNDKMGQELIREQRIENVMERALIDKEFFVMYQPKIDINTEKISGAEALIRWNSSDFGFMPPNKFIPLFESNGFIRKVDFFVYEEVFKFIRRQLDLDSPIIPISLNMSRCHTNVKAFIKELLRLTGKYRIPHELVEIEILERSVAGEKPILLEVTNELHRNGFTVAMDDFGSGQSSLNMLNSIPVDVLKFDQNFLRSSQNAADTREMIKSLISMAKKLKKKTVFEGVETQVQKDFLKTTDCDYIQGFFYSKPLVEEEFIKFLKEHS